jgi:hypothetical protein
VFGVYHLAEHHNKTDVVDAVKVQRRGSLEGRFDPLYLACCICALRCVVAVPQTHNTTTQQPHLNQPIPMPNTNQYPKGKRVADPEVLKWLLYCTDMAVMSYCPVRT